MEVDLINSAFVGNSLYRPHTYESIHRVPFAEDRAQGGHHRRPVQGRRHEQNRRAPRYV